jgi:hypothetical protein
MSGRSDFALSLALSRLLPNARIAHSGLHIDYSANRCGIRFSVSLIVKKLITQARW